jgi:hypothetical protein
LSQSQTNYWLHRLLPDLKCTLEDLGVLPERDPRQFARSERGKHEPPELIIDGTERRRQRPKDQEKQALHYSGKKKTHSDKNVVIVNAKTKRVGYLSATYPGRTHDKKIADNEPVVYPHQVSLDQDTGFQGYAPRVREIRQPKKAAQTGVDACRETHQSQDLTRACPGRTCAFRRQAGLCGQGCTAQYERWFLRFGYGHRVWPPQPARSVSQTSSAVVKQNLISDSS